VPLAIDLTIDGRVLAFTLVLALLTTVLFGLAPSLAATRQGISFSLKETQAGIAAAAGGFRLRNLLIAGQAALCMLLLAGAGLFVRSLLNASSIDPGFNTENILVVEANMGLRGYTSDQGKLAHQRLIDTVRNVPGVRMADMTRIVPLSMNELGSVITIEGKPKDPNQPVLSSIDWVGPHFFETMDIPVIAGRALNGADREHSLAVVVVNDTLAKRFWPGENPIGKRISFETETPNGER
jgi:MacB-like periplasmic core domain